jgi:hypothetical protein
MPAIPPSISPLRRPIGDEGGERLIQADTVDTTGVREDPKQDDELDERTPLTRSR